MCGKRTWEFRDRQLSRALTRSLRFGDAADPLHFIE